MKKVKTLGEAQIREQYLTRMLDLACSNLAAATRCCNGTRHA